jgi:hypothetical protein
MQESRRKETEAELEKRKSDATSKETLEDLEASKRVRGDDNRDQSVPSPDGVPEPRTESADGSETGDPM